MARMNLFEFTHKLKKQILQGGLETHAKSMKLICKSQNQNLLTDDPCIVDAAAILWALEIAQTEEFLHIIVEGDAKICLDAIMEELSSCPWRIRPLISNIKCLALNFVFCHF